MKFIYQDHANKPGIYEIVNAHSNRIYVGQAKYLKQRWRDHKKGLLNGSHQNKFLLNDYNKCKQELGHDDFLEFHVVEVMEGFTKEQRNKREEEYIAQHYDKQDSCYNFKQKTEAKDRACYSNTPEETHDLISANMKRIWSDPVQKEKRLEKIRSEEVREKISNSVKELWKNSEYDASIEKHKQNSQDAAYREKMSAIFADPEYREKLSDSLKKAWSEDDGTRRKLASENGKKVRAERAVELTAAIVKTKAKNYGKVMSPAGVIYEVYNLKKFARDNGLSPSELRNVMVDRLKKSSKTGWTKINA